MVGPRESLAHSDGYFRKDETISIEWRKRSEHVRVIPLIEDNGTSFVPSRVPSDVEHGGSSRENHCSATLDRLISYLENEIYNDYPRVPNAYLEH